MDGQHNQGLGAAGEDLAAEWLIGHGFRIVARNLRTDYGELDIIAEKSGHLHVVEVKTRRGTGYGSPLEAIDRRKQEHLRRSTMAALSSGIPGVRGHFRSIHIDAIGIVMSHGNAPVLEFVPDILV